MGMGHGSRGATGRGCPLAVRQSPQPVTGLLDMPPMKHEDSGRSYWRSLDELADTPEFKTFMHREFPAGASELMEDDRRSFLKIMGASIALAGVGLTGCRRWPEQMVLPYAERPEGSAPGMADAYATIMELGGVATGTLVTSYNGRPTKIEGNPDHPGSHGATTRYMQASILDLYDPDRSRTPKIAGEEKRTSATWDEWDSFSATHFDALRSSGGAGFWILSEATRSPSIEAQQAELRSQFPKATWVTWEPLQNANEAEGLTEAFGIRVRPVHDLTKARLIVSFDSDFLNVNPDVLNMSGGWAAGRRPDHGSMSRMLMVESGLSVTGSTADDRWAMPSSRIPVLVARVAANVLGNASIAEPFKDSGVETPDADLIADQLKGAAGTGAILAGPSQPPFVHRLVAMMNDALGNAGTTVSYIRENAESIRTASINDLASGMNAGGVETLLILGGNPAYDAPADLQFAQGLSKVKVSIHLADQDNETSNLCTWHLNRSHPLESWGDARAWDGTYSVQQPLILPLFEGRSSIELLAQVNARSSRAGFDLVRASFNTVNGTSAMGSSFDPAWRGTLHAGVLAGSASRTESLKVRGGGLSSGAQALAGTIKAGGKGIELCFTSDSSVYDGRFANNGWLQELPDPVTRLTWDNAVLLGPSTAKDLGVGTGDMVTISTGDASVEAAVLVQTGTATGTATLALGYGRRFAGRICSGAGFDFYPLRRSDAMWFQQGASITRSSGTYPLATVQDHFAIDSVGGKGTAARLPVLYREASIETFNHDPDFVRSGDHAAHGLSLWQAQQFDGAQYRWGMAIDLNTCSACSACVVACQAENNIPIVGKDQVLRGREMHWLRIDRYYRFEETSPGHYNSDQPLSVAYQPVTCQHCENAPCEQVCPVAATVHSSDGLNVMVYNRCVGTRYCSNNCPYKVRRFNYFDYFRREPLRETGLLQVQPDYYVKLQSGGDPLRRMQFNPEVTVRMRGVMEKCTFCTQRIEAAKIKAKNAWVKKPEAEKAAAKRIIIPDGEITPACAQACANDAIVFGDLMDPDSRVSKLHADSRAYELLGELHVKPRNRYLARLSNSIQGERFPQDHSGGHGHSTHGHEESHG
ncbi:MAG: molybdopterin oxidoreductase [Phycisphaerae bacterium]|nr:molybdopterin oxidoreductase [Phycisphaerae bacterium]